MKDPSEPAGYDMELMLMQKERHIADLEAKIKKSQFKHNRNLQECKINEERVRNLLKDEKNKNDKVGKLCKEKEEQNKLLVRKVAELRSQKEKEVGELKNQYNSLKEEVRTYERVLPTLTFLNQFGLRIESIPTYEGIFLELKNKITQLEQTQKRYEQYRAKTEEHIKTLKQNEDISNQKRQKVQTQLKEVLPRIAQSELLISQLKSTNEDLTSAIDVSKNDVEMWTDKCQGLESTVRENELKLEELDRAYSYQLNTKEQQIRALTQEEFDRYEDQIRSLENRLQIKDKMYVQQVQILEQEVYFLKNLITEEKDHFQQNYVLIKEEIARMQEEVNQERTDHNQAKKKYIQVSSQLVNSNKTKELLEAKVNAQEKKIDFLKEESKNKTATFSDIQVSQMKNLEENYSELLVRFADVTTRMNKFQEENRGLEEQVSVLRSELVSKNSPKHQFLQLPTNFLQMEEAAKRKSTESEHDVQLQQLHLQRKKTDSVHEKRRSIKQREQLLEELATIKKERDSLKGEAIKLKHKTNEQNSSYSEKQQELATQIKNFNFLKTKTQSLQQQLALANDQYKREKELAKSLREEIKQLKQSLNIQAQKNLKEKKDINKQFEVYKAERDKLKLQYVGRQKSLMEEINQLRKNTQSEQKNRRQILLLKREVGDSQKHKKELTEKNMQLANQLQKLKNMLDDLNNDFRYKERQSINLEEMLARQRKERSLLAVPSLEEFNAPSKDDQKSFNDIYSTVTKKESEINFLERQISDLKEQMEGMKISQSIKLEALELQLNDYIQTIIEMKMKCAQSEMKASESMHLYNQLKRRTSISSQP